MIELFNGVTLQHVENWDEIVQMPNFRTDILASTDDTRQVQIVGTYDEPKLVRCGLRDCHKEHNKGFLVSINNRLMTNVGRICGRNAFKVDWITATSQYIAQRRDYDRKNLIRAFQDRLPLLDTELITLIDGERGARWAAALVGPLRTRNKGVPDAAIARISDLIRADNGTLKISRQKTEAEREASRMGGANSGGNQSQFIEEEVGFLRGIRAFSDELSLSKLVGTDLRPHLHTLRVAEVDALPSNDLKDLARLAGEVDATVGRIRQSLSEHSDLLKRSNIAQLERVLEVAADRRQLLDYVQKLPT